MTNPSDKPSAERATVSQSSRPRKSFRRSLTSALKKPFQGWSRDLVAAKSNLDDDYNFSDGRRRYHAEYDQEDVQKS
ncbi:hypothetical protein K491DRAFT_610070 [Lophiostoma macrostomum CBS 122681]|uniref:Uncharacterized protein n=1 Tax=Lophiostoma macrostomum CBS 122681 TaxID=1314788 RepID=A0A6A6SPM3_9PLEO|nr:hypothetical protein K491DRAFT_610070 [Lophiostoma macrostomum CBS 122681]